MPSTRPPPRGAPCEPAVRSYATTASLVNASGQGGYRDGGNAFALRLLELQERVTELEARTTNDFWLRPEFSRVVGLRKAVQRAAATPTTEALQVSASGDSARIADRFDCLQRYEEALLTALAQAKELEHAGTETFGELPEFSPPPRGTTTWLSRWFAKAPSDEDERDLRATFTKFLSRMDPAAAMQTHAHCMYQARLRLRDTPFFMSAVWESLDDDAMWRFSVPVRIGLRPFSVVKTTLDGGTLELVGDRTVGDREQAEQTRLERSVAALQDTDFRSFLRVVGNAASANAVLDFDTRGYLVELAKATSPALVVEGGRATLAFAYLLNEDLLKCVVRVLMAAHKAPATLLLLRH